MSQERIQILLRKIKTILLEDKNINVLEKDLAKKYTLELYELISDATTVGEHGSKTKQKAEIKTEELPPQNPIDHLTWKGSDEANKILLEMDDKVVKAGDFSNSKAPARPLGSTGNQPNRIQSDHIESTKNVGTTTSESDLISPSIRQELHDVATRKESTPTKHAALFEPDEQKELSDKLGRSPVSDLRKALSINDKLLVVNDLFDGDHEAFQETIDILDAKYSFDEAKSYLSRYIIDKFQWLDEEKTTRARYFIKLVERRFLDTHHL